VHLLLLEANREAIHEDNTTNFVRNGRTETSETYVDWCHVVKLSLGLNVDLCVFTLKQKGDRILRSRFELTGNKNIDPGIGTSACILGTTNAYILTARSRVVEKLTGFQFMEPECSLPHSQVPATWPYSKPTRSSPYPHIPLSEDQS